MDHVYTEHELNALEELAHFADRNAAEQVGYAMAPGICAQRGFSSDVLLLVSLTVDASKQFDIQDPDFDPSQALATLYANLGIIRWCLDQRRVH